MGKVERSTKIKKIKNKPNKSNRNTHEGTHASIYIYASSGRSRSSSHVTSLSIYVSRLKLCFASIEWKLCVWSAVFGRHFGWLSLFWMAVTTGWPILVWGRKTTSDSGYMCNSDPLFLFGVGVRADSLGHLWTVQKTGPIAVVTRRKKYRILS